MQEFLRLIMDNIVRLSDYDGYLFLIEQQIVDFEILGEDVFGNILISKISGNIFILNHEDGILFDSMVDKDTFFCAVAESGLKWIDFYDEGCFDVYEYHKKNLTSDLHIHWLQPLVLGGICAITNSVLIPRKKHYIGHLKLISKLEGIEPGDHVNLR